MALLLLASFFLLLKLFLFPNFNCFRSVVFPFLVTCHASLPAIGFSVRMRTQCAQLISTKFMIAVVTLTFGVHCTIGVRAIKSSGFHHLAYGFWSKREVYRNLRFKRESICDGYAIFIKVKFQVVSWLMWKKTIYFTVLNLRFIL